VFSKDSQSTTLWQDDWSLSYPRDATKSPATLRQRDAVIATGACEADYAVDAL
jgi:hypothetical protein